MNAINEKYINLLDVETKEKYIDIVWSILQKSYESIGGFKSVSSKDELLHTKGIWKLVKKDGKIVAVAVYKDLFGRKAFGCGSDGSREGIFWLKKVLNEDVLLNRMWVEASGSVEKLFIKMNAIPIPAIVAKDILAKTGKEIISIDDDGYHYVRMIADEPTKKIMFGKIEN